MSSVQNAAGFGLTNLGAELVIWSLNRGVGRIQKDRTQQPNFLYGVGFLVNHNTVSNIVGVLDE